LSSLLQDKPRSIPPKHKQNETVEFMIADHSQYGTSWFTVVLVLQQNTHGTAPTGFALAVFACVTVRLWAANALRLEYGHNYIVTFTSSKAKNRNLLQLS
jgi:hypothetical protein